MAGKNTVVIDFVLFGVIALIWSSSFLFIKIAVAEISPYTLTAFRVLIAALLLYGYLRFQGQRINANFSDWAKLLFIGLMGNVFPFTLISLGETTIDSGMAAILMGIMPVATVLLAHLVVPEEPFTMRVGVGVIFGFSGVLMLVGVDALSGIGTTTWGQLSVLGGALCYAVTTVFVRRITTLGGPVMAAGSQICAALVAVPLALSLDQPWTLKPSLTALVAALILSVFATAFATLVYFRLVKNLGAATMSQVNYLIPVLGTLWGILFLAEQPQINAFIALALVITGVAIISSRNRGSKRIKPWA